MKKRLIGLSVAAAIATTGLQAGGDIAPVPVQAADSYWYAGLGLANDTVHAEKLGWFDNGVKAQDELVDIVGIVGYNYNRYFAVEGRIYKTIFEKDYADAFGVSLFLKPQYQFIDEENPRDNYFSVYGLLGLGYSQVQGTRGDEPGDPSIDGKDLVSSVTFQWGLGLSYTFTDDDSADGSGDWTIFAEYQNHFHNKSITRTKLYEYDPKLYHKLSSDNIVVGVLYRF